MTKTGKILIVDDDPLVLEALNQTFLDDYDVVMAASGPEALQALDKHNDLDTVVLDIKMARMDGLVTACRIREIDPDLPVIFHTGYPGDYSEREIDVEHQPFDYVGKNERPARLQRTVRNAVFMHRLKTSSSDLIELARREYGMVGRSTLMREVYQKIEKIGPTDSKVMVLGPTGVGKELVARAIHRRSLRSDKTLVVYSCSHKVPDLIDFFAEEYCRKKDEGIKVFEPAARDLMIEYDWPGNVRQLQESVQSLIDLSLSHLITRIEVQQHLSYAGAGINQPMTLSERTREFKKLSIIQSLARHGGNAAAAARELGLDPANLRKMIKDLDIQTG